MRTTTIVSVLVAMVTVQTSATGRPRSDDIQTLPHIAGVPTPTGTGGTCPLMAMSAGGAVGADSTASCPRISSLRSWQGLKFGLFLHWGAYSQIGVDASWSLNWKTACTFGNPSLCAPKKCSECTEADMVAYRKMYWGLSKTFNPTKFNATAWADVALAAGMKYFVMTTKHHDGFAMYNTSATGAPGQPVYGVTGPDCPTQRDLYGEVVTAMRTNGLVVGAYFSKADWHADSFWDPAHGFPTDRNVNYDIATNATRYAQFVDFEEQQLKEIQSKYKPDLFWLDAGWVGPNNGLQTLPLPEWAATARKETPNQLWVNRDGEVDEDYLTPENPPPDAVLKFGLGLRPKPWEVCMTLGSKWAYTVNDTYKSTETVVHTLANVIATGGSLLLDVGPMPTGELPPTALERLAEVGEWLKLNGEAIYDTVAVFPYAMNVTTKAQRPPSPEWVHAANASDGVSASCAQAGENTEANLTACQDYCFNSLSTCNTINFRSPTGCLVKACTPPGQPLVTKDGGFDVYTIANYGATSTQQWRLSRKGDVVYAILLLEGTALPTASTLELPFVVDAPGGADGSWPTSPLKSVSLIGSDNVEFASSDQNGLVLTMPASKHAAQPNAAVFRLDFSN